MIARRILMVALALAALAAMAPAMAQVVFPRSQAEIVTAAGRRHVIAVELATSADQLAQGLMFRKVMAADAGMLFDFGRTRAISMWMKNTLIPLDMLFLDPHGRVLGIVERAVPGSLAMIESPGPVRGVLELNGGTASRLGLEPGDRVLHPLFPAP